MARSETIDGLNSIGLRIIEQMEARIKEFKVILKDAAYKDSINQLLGTDATLLKTLVFMQNGDINEKRDYHSIINDIMFGSKQLSDYL